MSVGDPDLASFLASGQGGEPVVPLHIHTLLPGILPPFWSFLIAALSHYQIQVLHLDPSCLVLLSAFTFLYEAFVGVTPSAALLRHFFSLELVSEEQCSGCALLKMADASVPGALDAGLLPKAGGFRWQWVDVESAEARALFQPPSTHTTPNREWMREELNDHRLMPVLTRLEKLKRVGVTMAMVVREFICWWIAPLQRHFRPMWAYAGPRDPMRIQVLPLSPHVLHEFLHRLTGGNPDKLRQNGLTLYNFKAPEALVAKMPLFDEWGFLPGRAPRLPTIDRGGGSVLPAPEIAERLVDSSPAPRGVQPPETFAGGPPAVSLARGLQLSGRVPLPSPAAPPRVVLCLPSGPLLLGDMGP
ncbi:hypothetical protein D1007_46476 [Hordeum vulgare]|nr:hypothetical protein D1007_46476 [Hordeum vulgare]